MDENKIIKDLEDNIGEKMSGDELISLMNNTCDITPYSRIKEYRNVDDMLGKYKQTIILYEYEPKSGHWVVLYRNKRNKLCFYDSLGNKVDEINKDINKFRSNVGLPLVNNDLKNLMVNFVYLILGQRLELYLFGRAAVIHHHRFGCDSFQMTC